MAVACSDSKAAATAAKGADGVEAAAQTGEFEGVAGLSKGRLEAREQRRRWSSNSSGVDGSGRCRLGESKRRKGKGEGEREWRGSLYLCTARRRAGGHASSEGERAQHADCSALVRSAMQLLLLTEGKI